MDSAEASHSVVTTNSVLSPRSVLSANGVGKRYGANWVLRGVNLDLAPGQILALLGENGAGKSTFVKILSGAVVPDEGDVTLADKPLILGRPDAARRAGIAMVYQELSVCDEITVEDNVMLGREQSTWGWINRKQQREVVYNVLAKLGHPGLEPTRMVSELSIGAKQLVEIARALAQNARVLILDEPTSSLPAADAERLFETVKKLAKDGLSVIYISHFLEEIRKLCDSYLVLRDGSVAGSGLLEGTKESDIVRLMVGRNVDELYPKVKRTIGDEVLRIDQVSAHEMPHSVSFNVHRGEIFGLAGLVGAGRTETVRCIAGLRKTTSGQITIHDEKMGRVTPRQAIKAGIAMVSEDRKSEGLAQDLSIRDNITLSRLGPYSYNGWLRGGARNDAANEWMRRLEVKANSASQNVSALSGGNQQKVAIARVLHQDADCLLLDEPTRGVDVGTKAEIYRLIGETAAAGKAVLFVSSYFQELLGMCDRIAVMSRGRIVDVRPVADWDEPSLLLAAMGGDLES
jgi:ribose transport system ATP-binding protein